MAGSLGLSNPMLQMSGAYKDAVNGQVPKACRFQHSCISVLLTKSIRCPSRSTHRAEHLHPAAQVDCCSSVVYDLATGLIINILHLLLGGWEAERCVFNFFPSFLPFLSLSLFLSFFFFKEKVLMIYSLARGSRPAGNSQSAARRESIWSNAMETRVLLLLSEEDNSTVLQRPCSRGRTRSLELRLGDQIVVNLAPLAWMLYPAAQGGVGPAAVT